MAEDKAGDGGGLDLGDVDTDAGAQIIADGRGGGHRIAKDEGVVFGAGDGVVGVDAAHGRG